MRLAAIDIGTNSVHMIVVQVRPDLLVRGHRPGKRDGPAGRRRAGRQEADQRGDDVRAAGAVEVRAARPVASGGRDPGGGDERDPRGRERRRIPGRHRADDRDPAADHHRHRRSAADPHRRRLRRRYAKNGRRHRHRRRQRGDHARHRAAGPVRTQLQDWRHPADRAVRQLGSAQRTRRTQAGAAHQRADRPLREACRRGRLRPRHRHVGHDPVDRHRGDGHRPRHRAAGNPQPAGAGQEHPAVPQDGHRAGSRGAPPACPGSIRGAPT